MDYVLDEEIDQLLWIELRFGPLQKTIKGGYDMNKADALHQELVTLLQKYQKQLNLKSPVPRIRVWATNDKLNFLFFDKNTGKRVLLGAWLSGKETYHEH
jgi:hypothetical protein